MNRRAIALLIAFVGCAMLMRPAVASASAPKSGGRGVTFSAAVSRSERLPVSGVRLVFRASRELPPGIPRSLTIAPVSVPAPFSKIAEGQWISETALRPGALVRVVAVVTWSGDVHVGAVFSLRNGEPDRVWYYRRFFRIGLNASVNFDDGLLYALTTGALSHYNMVTGRREFVWVLDTVYRTLGYFRDRQIADLHFSRYQGKAFAKDFGAISRLLSTDGNRLALVKGLPFMPVRAEYVLVGGLGVFPLVVYLDRGEKGVEKVFEHQP